MTDLETIPTTIATGELAELLIATLAARFPTVAIRRSRQDAIAIENEAGDDWELVIRAPDAGELELPTDNQRHSDDEPIPFDVDEEGKNNSRADWALAAVETFQAETGTDDEDAIGDLVADLAHLCDREGARFGWSVRDMIERGLRAYEQEVTDEEPEELEAADVVGAAA